jgi:hypothetical protein
MRCSVQQKGKGGILAIKGISRWEFRELVSLRLQLDSVVGEQVEWFADDARQMIGTITYRSGDNWGYAILRRLDRGQFRVSTLKEHLPTVQSATTNLFQAMRAREQPSPKSVSSKSKTLPSRLGRRHYVGWRGEAGRTTNAPDDSLNVILTMKKSKGMDQT